MILLIDNYDSFTYNLYQYVAEINDNVKVVRNDKFDLDDIDKEDISHIIISPGPGHPRDAGKCVDVIKKFGGKIPILGVCLGHQAIGIAYNGEVVHAKYKMHGKVSKISHDGKGIFEGVENPCEVTRYHSLIINRENLPSELIITATSNEGEIMAVRHREYDVYGVQFHPESIFTKEGKRMIKNFLNLGRRDR